jgi:hypothetical protein
MGGQMTEQEAVHTADEAAEIANSQGSTDAPAWHANLWGDVPAAIQFAKNTAGTANCGIVFSIRDNGQVWTFNFN